MELIWHKDSNQRTNLNLHLELEDENLYFFFVIFSFEGTTRLNAFTIYGSLKESRDRLSEATFRARLNN